MERWRPVVGFEGLYEVSELGGVRSLARIVHYSGRFTRRHAARTLRAGIGERRHLLVALQRDKFRKTGWIHRLVLEAFVGPCPEGMQCRHLDGDPANNRLSNLKWGTPKENQADRERHGRTCRGDRHWSRLEPDRFRRTCIESAKACGERAGSAKLTEAQVREIISSCRPHATRQTLEAAAAKYGVSHSTIHSIVVSRLTWRHIA